MKTSRRIRISFFVIGMVLMSGLLVYTLTKPTNGASEFPPQDAIAIKRAFRSQKWSDVNWALSSGTFSDLADSLRQLALGRMQKIRRLTINQVHSAEMTNDVAIIETTYAFSSDAARPTIVFRG